MIKSKSQTWEKGRTVKIGSLELVITEKIPTPGDGRPDAYRLRSLDATREYRFQPYNGLVRLDPNEDVEPVTDAINANEILSHTLRRRQAG
jgi:hypothetical protein